MREVEAVVRRKLLAVGIAVGVMLTALAGTSSGAVQSISIVDFDYIPGDVTVPPGTDITWTNNGQAPHTATRCDNSACPGLGPGTGTDPAFFDSGTLNPG